MNQPLHRFCATALGVTLLGSVAGAQFSNNAGDIPQGSTFNSSWSENIDFGDVDLDGDWDAIFSDGGDSSNDQDRIWINNGLLQAGTVGTFTDETSTRFPSVVTQGRDIEFVDFDNDGDIDIYNSNTSTNVNQTNRWFTNQGGLQAGTLGFYVDETAARWVGLGGAGSSIAVGEVLGGGGFLDFSCDCDFGDLDNDGDLDLVHSSYGGIFGGNVPTRIFLNDGLGFFSEFNPSGFQLVGQTISNGNAGLWCQGTQSANTTNSDGTNCDIASSALDIDLGDTDGDLDLDILHGARQELPRFFTNQLDKGAGLAFRDITGTAFESGYSIGDGHYEQEMSDFDGDGDLDLYGLNWRVQFGFTDTVMENDGAGNFINRNNLSGSDQDDNEGDFVDYDNDGDVDLFVAAFTGQDRLYRNNNNGGAGFSFTNVSGSQLPGGTSRTALDVDAADVDNDGDYDTFVSNDKFGFQAGINLFYENNTAGSDTTAPSLYNLEQAPDRISGPEDTVIRVRVLDNAAYYLVWYYDVELEYTVNGGSAVTVDMQSSGGEIFRGVIPGNLVGDIDYRVICEDREANQTISSLMSFTAFSSSFCDDADGSLASCPCTNPGNPTSGCDIQQGTGGVQLDVVAQSQAGGNGATVTGSGFPGSASPTAIVIRATGLDAGAPVVFGDGLRCIGTPLVRLAATFAVAGTSTHTFGHGTMAGTGDFYYQLWFRNTPAMFCTPDAFNLSNGRTLLW